MNFIALKRLSPLFHLNKWLVIWYNLTPPQAMSTEHMQALQTMDIGAIDESAT